MGMLIDFTNKKVGKFLVIKKISSQENIWLVVCECGKEFKKTSGYLLRKNIKSKSCRECYLKNSSAHDVNKKCVISFYKYSAKRRKIYFNLSDDELSFYFSKNCFYCDAPPSNWSFSRKNRPIFYYSGIDRIDNKKGYTIENCVSCCIVCNQAKNDLSIKDFINHIKKIILVMESKNV